MRDIEIGRLIETDWRRFRSIRLRSLEADPDAFGATLAMTQARGESDWRAQVQRMPTFLAVAPAGDVGVVRGVHDEDDAASAWLLSLWVELAFRARGIGEGLVRAVAEWARREGCARLLLDVAVANRAATRLYESVGFVPTGETGTLPAPRQHIVERRMALRLRAANEG